MWPYLICPLQDLSLATQLLDERLSFDDKSPLGNLELLRVKNKYINERFKVILAIAIPREQELEIEKGKECSIDR